MKQVVLGAVGALILTGVGLFWWQGRAQVEDGAPPPVAAEPSPGADALPLADPGALRGPAPPEASDLTREEVRAELRAAQESGNVIADNESGRTLREVYPNRYPKDNVAQAKTREQVKAELAEAQRTGDIIADGESGKKLNELYPSRYPKN